MKPAKWNSAALWPVGKASPYQVQLAELVQALESRFKPKINMTTVNTCVQNPGEIFDDYFPRKLKVFNMHSRTEQPTDTTDDSVCERESVQTLIDGLSLELRMLFVRHCVGWQSAHLTDVKKYCLHAEIIVQD